MVYCTPEDVRLLCGFTSTEAPDNILSYYIYKANIHVINDIVVRRKNAILLAGPSKYEWYSQHYPIADINGDGLVNSSDVQVYLWKDRADESSKSPLTVQAINWLTGRIVLTSEPSRYDVITADYSFYPNEVDWKVLRDAEAYYAGFMFAIKKWLHIPEWTKFGTITTRQAVKPYIYLYNEYKRCMVKLKTRKWKKGVAYSITKPDRPRMEDMVEEEPEELIFPG